MPKCSDCQQYKSKGITLPEYVGGQGMVDIFTCTDCIDLKKIASTKAKHELQAEYERRSKLVEVVDCGNYLRVSTLEVSK